MQRLARFKLQEINQNVTALFVHYDEIIKILRSHLPPSTATLFAKPEIKADQVTVEWYSELEGQPVLITQEMQEDKRFKPTISLIQQRLNAIMTLNQELMTKGVLTPEQSAWLAQLVEGATHDTRQIYLVNNEPVITGWGIGKKVEPPAPPPVVPLTAPKHRWCYWLLPLLLLLLGLLAWWWLNREPVVPPKVEPPKVEEPKKEEPKPEPPKEEPKVEEPKPEPVQEPPKEEPKVEEPKPEPKKNCRVVEKPTDAPQLAIIFNNASGMRYTLLESAKKVAIFDEKLRNPAKYGITQQDVYYMYQSEWTDTPVLHLFPHWNWTPGQEIDMWCYYNQADEVELFVNGKSQGVKRKDLDNLHVAWRVKFEPGTVKVIARESGKVVAEKEICTAGKPAEIRLTPDRSILTADGKDLCFVTVEVLDEKGNLCPDADNLVNFTVQGNGFIAGVDNGNPVSMERFKDEKRKAFYGKCLVVIQNDGKPGKAKLTATSEGLRQAVLKISAEEL